MASPAHPLLIFSAIKSALAACLVAVFTQGCGAVGQLHTQAGVMVGNNYGDESQKGFSETQGVAELGYVTGGPRSDTPRWGFGGTAYLTMADPPRPGIKAIARRRFNRTVSLDFSAGPMITYESTGSFNGFTGGVALNISFVTLRSEFVTWPFDAWYDYSAPNGGILITPVYQPSGHEKVWFNGVSMNGTASWVTAALATAAFIVLAASGAFQ